MLAIMTTPKVLQNCYTIQTAVKNPIIPSIQRGFHGDCSMFHEDVLKTNSGLDKHDSKYYLASD